ncbi:hypothetical protein SAMN04488522_10361 [Pedobacter caeni]|uniref:Uncharacterized protein n=1 Tax=Pedobacter caeni TaxID=288992 RepID=A0A1M5D3Y0_9SPHI|nr:hypothetical protein SAMN04488522_10361 [Pedobacter caeni]
MGQSLKYPTTWIKNSECNFLLKKKALLFKGWNLCPEGGKIPGPFLRTPSFFEKLRADSKKSNQLQVLAFQKHPIKQQSKSQERDDFVSKNKKFRTFIRHKRTVQMCRISKKRSFFEDIRRFALQQRFECLQRNSSFLRSYILLNFR